MGVTHIADTRRIVDQIADGIVAGLGKQPLCVDCGATIRRVEGSLLQGIERLVIDRYLRIDPNVLQTGISLLTQH